MQNKNDLNNNLDIVIYMISNTLKKSLTSFSTHNNTIKMNMTRQEYIFYKWSYHRNLKKVNSGDSDGAVSSAMQGQQKTMQGQQKMMGEQQRRRLFWRLV